jgi:hypothetical protein
MDRPGWLANTDNIVVVDPARQRLLWVPRDLWCATLEDRVNAAFKRGQHSGLADALAEHGIAVQHAICLQRAAVEQALTGVVVTVHVPERVELWYPVAPQTLCEDGRKPVTFAPPTEVLSGERIHQWIGARHTRLYWQLRHARRQLWEPPDFRRIARQQELLRRLLDDGFDFRSLLADPELVSISSSDAIAEVGEVAPTWKFETFRDVVEVRLDGKLVLMPRTRGDWRRKLRVLARAASRLPSRALRELRTRPQAR